MFIGTEKLYLKVQKSYVYIWNAVTVLCGQLDCDDGHL